MTRVFLSASFPSKDRHAESGDFDDTRIGMAATAVAEVSLRLNSNLVFGGHPSISPLIRNARERIASGLVTAYQSDFFANDFPEDTSLIDAASWGSVIHTEAGPDRGTSLQIMRRRMLENQPELAFFVGGMAGVEAELDLLRGLWHDRCSLFLFVSPGGRAARLADVIDRTHLDHSDVRVRSLGGSTYALLGGGYHDLVVRAFQQAGVLGR